MAIKSKLISDKPLNTELIIGRQGTGKSSYVFDLIENKYKNEKRKIIIVSPMVSEKVTEKNIILIPSFLIDEVVIRHLKNMVVFFDDCRLYTSSNPDEKITKAITDKLAVARHEKNDIYLVYHMFREVNPKIFTKISRLTIFKGVENLELYKTKIVNFEAVKTAYDYVNDRKTPSANKTINL